MACFSLQTIAKIKPGPRLPFQHSATVRSEPHKKERWRPLLHSKFARAARGPASGLAAARRPGPPTSPPRLVRVLFIFIFIYFLSSFATASPPLLVGKTTTNRNKEHVHEQDETVVSFHHTRTRLTHPPPPPPHFDDVCAQARPAVAMWRA